MDVCEQNKEIILRLYRQVVSLGPSQVGGRGFTQGVAKPNFGSLEPFYGFYAKINKAFPEYQLTINSILTKENQVSVCYSISGTQKGYFMGMPPSNETLTIVGVDIFRLENDRVIEYREIVRQMSALPPQSYKIQAPSSSSQNSEDQAIYTFNKES